MKHLPPYLAVYLKHQRIKLFIRFFVESVCWSGFISTVYLLGAVLFSYTFNPVVAVIIFSFTFLGLWGLRVLFFKSAKKVSRYLYEKDPDVAEPVYAAVNLLHEKQLHEHDDIWNRELDEFLHSLEKRLADIKSRTIIRVFPGTVSLGAGISSLIFAAVAFVILPSTSGPSKKLVASGTLKVEPPQYTSLSKFEVPLFSVPVSLPVGSLVEVDITAEKDVREIRLKKDEMPLYACVQKKNRQFNCQVSIAEEGHQSFRVEGLIGVRWFVDKRSIEMTVIRDEKPTVRLLKPEKDLTLRKPERVSVTFESRDDYGIEKAYLAYSLDGGDVVREPLKIRKGKSHILYTYQWDLSSLPEAETVDAWIEVHDNNPFVEEGATGRSRVFSIEFLSPLKSMKMFLNMLSEVLDKGVGILGFQIEKVMKQERRNIRKLKKKLEHLDDMEKELFQLYETARKYLKDIPGAVEIVAPLDSAYRQLQEAVLERRSSVARSYFDMVCSREIEQTEKFLIQVDDTIREETLRLIRREIEKVLKKKEELIAALEKGEDPARILQQLQLLENRLKELLTRLAQHMAQFPDEFLNSKDVNRVQQADQYASLLKAIREALEKGDVQKARQLLQRYFQELEKLSDSLDNIRFQMAMGGMQTMRTFAEVASEIEALRESQKMLMQEHINQLALPRGMEGEDVKKMMEELKRKFENSTREFQKVQQAEERKTTMRGFINFASQLFEKVKNLIEEGDLENASEKMLSLEKMVKAISSTMPRKRHGSEVEVPLHEAKQLLDELLELGLESENGQKLSQKEGEIAHRLGKLLRKADELDSEPLTQMLEEALKYAKGAQKKIVEGPQAEALKKELNVIQRLEEARQEMEKLRKQMESKQNFMWLLGGEEEYGLGGDVRRGVVKIPEKEKYLAKEKFRKKLQRALQQGLPREEKEKNLRYYRELVE